MNLKESRVIVTARLEQGSTDNCWELYLVCRLVHAHFHCFTPYTRAIREPIFMLCFS